MRQSAFIFGIAILLLISCVSNDYSSEYQKDIKYDGLTSFPIDSVNIITYHVLNNNKTEEVYTKITKWYDINGYNSMIKSHTLTPAGYQQTIEKITRDKNSLPIAKDITISHENVQPIVILARLKTRTNKIEEWLFRHYVDENKHFDYAHTVSYTDSSRIVKKNEGKNKMLSIIEEEFFNSDNRLIEKKSTIYSQPHIRKYYNTNNLVDSILVQTYADSTKNKIAKYKLDIYKHDLSEHNDILKSYIYRSDSLAYVVEYQYTLRK